MKVVLVDLDPSKYYEDDELSQRYGLENGDIIEVRQEDDYYYPIDMVDSEGYELCLYKDQINFPVRATRLAKKVFPDAIEQDGWLWIKKKI